MTSANASADSRAATSEPAAEPDHVEQAFDALGRSDMVGAWFAMASFPAAIAAEYLQFAAHRLQAQAKLVEAVSVSPDIFWALTTRSGFVTTAVDDYQRETEVIARRLADPDRVRDAA